MHMSPKATVLDHHFILGRSFTPLQFICDFVAHLLLWFVVVDSDDIDD